MLMPLFISSIEGNSFLTTVSFQAGNRLQSNASNNAQLLQTMLSVMSGNSGAAQPQYAMPYGAMPYAYAGAPLGYQYAAYGQPPMQAPAMPV